MTTTPRRVCVPPTVSRTGSVTAILAGGQGKVSVVTGDPGEPRKVPATDK